MHVALAWLDLADPTDRAVADGLAAELLRLGHRVSLVGPKRRIGEPSRAFRGAATVRRFGGAGAARALAAFHEAERVDVWHCHAFGRDASVFTEAAASGRWPLVVTLHLVLKDYLPFLGGPAGLRALLEPAASVAVVSRSAREELEALCPERRGRIEVVYNGVEPRPRLRVPPPRAPYALCPARLAPYKGQDLLVMAFAEVAARVPGLRLLLCGRDQLRGGLDGLIGALGLEDRVSCLGERPAGEVAALVQGASFVVLPSRRENLPLTLLEAMAAGKAVIATRAGGAEEIVTDRVNGLLVPPGDVRALAETMLRLQRHPPLRGRLGRAAARRAAAFSWERAARAYSALYAKTGSPANGAPGSAAPAAARSAAGIRR